MSTWELFAEAEEQTVALARDLAPLLRPGDLVILSGGLGAGKTFFTRALCYAVGLDENERVTSPTFALACEYPTEPALIHVDCYRLSHEAEVFDLGLDVERLRGAVLVVEWGAPYMEVLGGDALVLELGGEPRKVRIFGEGARGSALARAFAERAGAVSIGALGE